MVVGGDGTVHCAVNGLALGNTLNDIPICAVCAGSGNALVSSIGHTDPRVSILSLVQGMFCDSFESINYVYHFD